MLGMYKTCVYVQAPRAVDGWACWSCHAYANNEDNSVHGFVRFGARQVLRDPE